MLDPKKRIYAWSFNLPHNGHIAMAREFTDWADSLVVWIWHNPTKTTTKEFHPVESKIALEHALLDLPQDVVKKIHVDFFDWLITSYCQKKWIKCIYKSYRNDTDYRDEMMQAEYNKKINPNIKTVLVDASNDKNEPYVSSSGEKALIKLQWNQTGEDTTLLVKHAMEMRLNKQYIIGMMWEIGSGKSYTWEEFVRIAQEYKIPAHNIDFDTLWHNIHKAGEDYQHVREEIRQTFGDTMMNEDWSTNTRALRVVFSDPLKLQQLNAIMKESLQTELRDAITWKTWLLLMNCAILAEHNMWALTNNNIVSVSVDRATQIARILSRENSEEKRAKAWGRFVEFTTEEAQQRIDRQYSLDQKNAYFIEQQATKRYGKLIHFENTSPTQKDTKEAFRDTIEAVDTDASLRFTALYSRLWLTGNAPELFKDIYFRYLNNNLTYHNWEHIKDWLRKIHRHRDSMEDPDIVEMAYFFHDIIYDSKNITTETNKTNEFLSADMAKKFLIQHGMHPLKAAKVYSLIMATKHDARHAYTTDEKWIIDIDLWVLSADFDTYMWYATAIRQEYSWVPQDIYVKERIKVLEKLKNKNSIYLTTEFSHLHNQAKINLETEIQILQQEISGKENREHSRKNNKLFYKTRSRVFKKNPGFDTDWFIQKEETIASIVQALQEAKNK
jgi:predicted metal-dependent HD superfamily phosphohydrolase/phosphopantetheine adenylyltransferase/dephospho-CoA kinase